mmetsp:Transcript_26285/g.53607  ORF Transcript_26285/g.53607 Transcript_26285/m.53607 type:complete len:421 (-) Transcript_26285:151-1413(-)
MSPPARRACSKPKCHYPVLNGKEFSDWIPFLFLAIGALSYSQASSGGILSSGYYHTCAISRTGAAECWGDGSTNQTKVPKEFARFRVFSNSSRNNNTWSIIFDFQVPNGTDAFNFSDPDLDFWLPPGEPITWETVPGWKAISAGYSHTCGITAQSRILCWGQGKNRQSLLPQWMMKHFETLQWKGISAGTSNSCGVMDNGTAVCWGANEEAQSEVPPSISNWSMVDCGYAHCCGVSSNGTGKCWGWNGVTAGSLIPFGQATVPRSVDTWRSISAGFVHSCGVAGDGRGHCWGNNANGQLDIPRELETPDSQLDIRTPFNHTPAVHHARWRALSCSYFHTCGLTVNGSVLCWGNNDASQAEPPVALGTDIRLISTGFVHNCGVNSTGFPLCWGPVPHGSKSYWYLGQTLVPSTMMDLMDVT